MMSRHYCIFAFPSSTDARHWSNVATLALYLHHADLCPFYVEFCLFSLSFCKTENLGESYIILH